MKEVLQDIYIGRTSLDSIEFKYDVIEVPLYRGEDREFQIFIKNFAAPTFISFLPDDSIRDYLILVPSKHHVQKNDYVKIVIRIPYNSKPMAEGIFYVVTGYGAQKKGFKLSVGSGKNRSSVLSAVGDLSEWKNNPAGDVFDHGGTYSSDRVKFISEDEEEKTAPKPAFSVKSEPSYGKGSKAAGTSKSEKYKPKKVVASDASLSARRNEMLSPLEKISAFISLVLIVLLIAVFIYIQFSDVESLFNFDQTFLLALIGVGFVIFILLLLSMFLKRTTDD
jgi:hypothetical protein